ncbi:tetratricopeptide repeat protein [Streptomyces sp. NBC_01304]|uniref:tetratricopeptide repeat protein n=1 Tax=Streptomyces sp. NBC_01304 TaxID=2903818 RepID=UPI002E10C59B|nr:hypothetical protein OG430_03125 [Streptomyces sp. NBC_01304]
MAAPNDSLLSLIREAGWTYEALARRVNEGARQRALDTTYDRTAVAHWVRGSRPRRPVPDLLCELFTQRLGRLVEPVHLGLADARPPALEGAASLLAAIPGLEPNSMQSGGSSHTRVPEQRGRPGQTVPASRAQVWRGAERFFVQQTRALGGRHTEPVLSAYLRSTFGLADGALRTEAEARVGLVHAARTAVLLAGSYTDACRTREAQDALIAAEALADYAQDRSVQAIALRQLSENALQQGGTARAAAYLHRALEVSDRTPGPVRAYVATQAARVCAARAERRQALEWLQTAFRLLPQHSEGEDPFAVYPAAALHYQQAAVLLRLGEPREAHAALTASFDERPTQEARSILFTLLARGWLHHAEGRRAEAAESADAAEEMNATIASTRAARDIARIRSAQHP